MSRKNVLLKETDIRKHLTHHYNIDPNKIIFEEFLRLYGKDYAEKFLAYRRDFEAVKKGRVIMPYPITLNMALINSCNLRCTHCYRQYNPDKSNKNMLSWEEISRVITECSEIGIPAILFGTESEHFMHKDAMKAIEFAAEKGIMDIFVATNGVLLSDSIIDRLIEIGITRLTISLDALTEETYKKVRGGDFRKVIENINYFLEKREKSGKRLPVLRITFVKFNLNEHEELAFHNYWQDKVDIVDIQSLLDIKNIDVLKYKSIDSLDCTYPWTMLYISWDGSYKPCCSEYCKYLTLGNIAENTIAEIWKSKKMLRLRRDMLDLKNFPGACINCMRSLHSNTEFKAIKKIQ